MNSIARRSSLLLTTIFSLSFLATSASALSVTVATPSLHYPKGYDTKRSAAINQALQSKGEEFLGGLTSFWEPRFSTTLVYDGDAEALNGFLVRLYKLDGMTVALTFSPDLSKETGSALQAGSWWVIYSHTEPDTLTVRINLASEALGKKLRVQLPKS